MNRRNLISAAAGLCLPASIQAATQPKIRLKKNLVLISNTYSLWGEGFQDGKGDCAYANSYFKNFKGKMSWFSGMTQPEFSANDGHFVEHATFTGLKFDQRMMFPNRTFVSLDQHVAERAIQETRHRSLVHSVSGNKNLSWNLQAQRVPSYNGAVELHQNLFGVSDINIIKRNISKQRIILKELKVNTKRRWQGTPQEVQMVESIDYQLSELDTREKWLKVRRPRQKMKFEASIENKPLLNAGHNYDLIFEALKQKQTKIAMLTLSGPNMVQGIPGISEAYHTCSHHGTSSDLIMMQKSLDKYHLRQLATFLEKLESEKMLDDTIVLFSQAHSNQNRHSTRNIPAFLFGGGFEHKKTIDCLNSQGQIKHPTISLFSSILRQLGFRDTSFSGHSAIIPELFEA